MGPLGCPETAVNNHQLTARNFRKEQIFRTKMFDGNGLGSRSVSKFCVYIHVTVLHRNDFLWNNQPDALIIPILFRYKTVHISDIFFVYHQEFSTIHSALVSFMQVSDDRFQAESGRNLPVPTVQ